MERRRGRGHGSEAVLVAGLAMVVLWVVSGGAGAGAAEKPLPAVTLVAIEDGSYRESTPGCDPVSSVSLGRGEIEVRRTGSTATDLSVNYDVKSDDTGDFDVLPGSVTIPAGAATASIQVTPRFVGGPVPVHVHRSATLTVVAVDGTGYAVGGEGSATISLRFDVDIEPCVPPTTGPTTPVVPTGVSDGAAPGTSPSGTSTLPATGNPTTLPFTGSPFTAALAGLGSAMVALGGFGLRCAHPRDRRRRPRL